MPKEDECQKSARKKSVKRIELGAKQQHRKKNECEKALVM